MNEIKTSVAIMRIQNKVKHALTNTHSASRNSRNTITKPVGSRKFTS